MRHERRNAIELLSPLVIEPDRPAAALVLILAEFAQVKVMITTCSALLPERTVRPEIA